MRYTWLLILITTSTLQALPTRYRAPLKRLRRELKNEGVPLRWFNKARNNRRFRIYRRIKYYFRIMPEHRAKRMRKRHSYAWYRRNFALDHKIRLGRRFVRRYRKLLRKLERRNGIPGELIAAILGMESNYADQRQIGNFYIFNALVSQYILIPRLRAFAKRQLVALYRFARRIRRPVYYFIGSYAGASGWAQFIPTSQERYFRDINGRDREIDIYNVADCLASIENYLHGYGLHRGTVKHRKKLESAVYAYNHSKHYVRAVLEIYRGLRR